MSLLEGRAFFLMLPLQAEKEQTCSLSKRSLPPLLLCEKVEIQPGEALHRGCIATGWVASFTSLSVIILERFYRKGSLAEAWFTLRVCREPAQNLLVHSLSSSFCSLDQNSRRGSVEKKRWWARVEILKR